MQPFRSLVLFPVVVLLSAACGHFNPPPPKLFNNTPASKLPLSQIKLPEGFKIEIYAEDVKNARSMCLSPNGTLFVGTRDAGNVYALQDTDGDHKVDKMYTLAKGLNMPNGVALRNGDLYIAEVNRIIKLEKIESTLANPPQPVVVYDQYPTEKHHGWKYIAFGPDGKLYVPVGAPCNICEPDKEIYASITRLDLETKKVEIVQRGIRNTVGFTWHPDNKELWFTDNGRDMLGDDLPSCELNHATGDGQNFGYPYCHQGDTPDPEFGSKHPCSDFIAPAQKLGPHVAPLGLEFYTGKMFPAAYKNQILVALHGSWNRTKKSGYSIMMVTLDNKNQVTSYKPFAEGWLNTESQDVWGRPVDLEFLPDGSMLVSDDYADVIYRVSYAAK
jgi:glucose/arabinose dehydrogenase